eukprot:749977-Hanusia_phi.AAC.3
MVRWRAWTLGSRAARVVSSRQTGKFQNSCFGRFRSEIYSCCKFVQQKLSVEFCWDEETAQSAISRAAGTVHRKIENSGFHQECAITT